MKMRGRGKKIVPYVDNGTAEDIDYWPEPVTKLSIDIDARRHDAMLDYCRINKVKLSAFIESAIQRELDFQAGEKRYSIKMLEVTNV